MNQPKIKLFLYLVFQCFQLFPSMTSPLRLLSLLLAWMWMRERSHFRGWSIRAGSTCAAGLITPCRLFSLFAAGSASSSSSDCFANYSKSKFGWDISQHSSPLPCPETGTYGGGAVGELRSQTREPWKMDKLTCLQDISFSKELWINCFQ